MTTGLEAASTCRRTSSPPSTGAPIRTHWLRGLMPFTGVPSGRYTSPSHWKPGMFSSKPRSRIASTVRPAHASGTVPVTRNQLVPHGAPQRVPTVIGSTSAASPSATGTGSPGACHTATSRGTDSGYTAGRTRSSRTRLRRASTRVRSSCMRRSMVVAGSLPYGTPPTGRDPRVQLPSHTPLEPPPAPTRVRAGQRAPDAEPRPSASARACSASRRSASAQSIGSASAGTSQKVKVDVLMVSRRPVMTLLCGSVRA